MIYGIKKGAIEEHAFGGYDIEFGVPIFGFFPKLNNKFETKFYITRYNFQKKNIGVVLRLEQPILNYIFNQRDTELILTLGSNKKDKKDWNHFIGLSMRISLNRDARNLKLSGIRKRMMDNVVRDIVTSNHQNADVITPVFYKQQEIKNIIFIGISNDNNYEGDGSFELPYTTDQLINLVESKAFIPQETDLIIPIIINGYQLNNEESKQLNCLILKYSVTKIDTNETFSLQSDAQDIVIAKCLPDFSEKVINQTSSSTLIPQIIKMLNRAQIYWIK